MYPKLINLQIIRPENLKSDKPYLCAYKGDWFVSELNSDKEFGPYFDLANGGGVLKPTELDAIFELPRNLDLNSSQIH